MESAYSNELGLIFIINYPWNDGTLDQDPFQILEKLMNLEDGFFNFRKYHPHKKVGIWFVSCFPKDEGPNTLVTKLKLSKDESKFEIESKINFGSVNLGNKDVLSTILTNIVVCTNASRYVMFLYNHSSQFGMFNTDPSNSAVSERFGSVAINYKVNSFLTPDENLLVKYFSSNKTGNFSGMSQIAVLPDPTFSKKSERITRDEISKDFTNDMLTNSELLIALSRALSLNGLGNDNPLFPTLEIIFSAGCYALNMDLAYSLKDITRFLVGAQCIMPPISYPYPDIVNALIDELNAKKTSAKIDYERIISDMLASFGKSYEGLPVDIQKRWLKPTYVTAIDCAKTCELKEKMNLLVCCLMLNPEESVNVLNYAITESTDLTCVYFKDEQSLYDITELCSNIKLNTANSALKACCDEVIEGVKQARLNSEFKDAVNFNKELNFSGLSVYFPTDVSTDEKLKSYTAFCTNLSPTQSFFSKESYWPEMVNLFLKQHDLSRKNKKRLAAKPVHRVKP